ncbi:hypothetical protein HQO38_18515 [Rhodococcus fascians]|nr:hypothetical protein [Rhodococcus fascians]MBY4140934.1 hypothetical protein [Rhodococcus fascians]MBY4219598.1 hypothetical protein [Rhodococcus fascians]MBY4221907.1 hypothetical protein [Rhodococcus fascians]MBY4233908.1 hypothetical protein [Rhodococcus fascians]
MTTPGSTDTGFVVAVGDTLPPFTRTTGLDNWNRYAAVNNEFVGIHMDDDAGRAAGFDSAFGMGNLLWSYLHCLLRDWVGEHGRIDRLQCQFRSPNTKGMTITAHGTVTAVDRTPQGTRVDLDVWIEDQNGTKLTPGTATVTFAP